MSYELGQLPARVTSQPIGRCNYESTEAGGLGFSLKPPRWIRKMQPGVYIRKHPLVLAPLALAVPGVAPFLLHAATAGAGLLARGATAAAGGITNLLRSTKLPTGALQQAAQDVTQPFTAPLAIQQPAAPTLQPSDMVMAPSPQFDTSGSGGGAVASPSSPEPAPTQAGINPLFVLGGLALVALAAGRRRS